MDLRYDVDLTYDTEYSCEDSGCNSDGICRCGSICNPEIRSVNSWVIANAFADFRDELQYYVIDRFASRLQTDDFIINWSHGYYGDEIDEVKLNDAAKKEIMQIKGLQGADLIEFSLASEYGNVLPSYKNRKWIYTEGILVDDLFLGVPSRRDLNRARIDSYKDQMKEKYKPILLCERHEQLYRVIDGYHRYTALKELEIKKVNIIYYDKYNARSLGEFELGGAL
jgi:hypothetical protein